MSFPPCVRIVGREGCQGDLDAHFCWCTTKEKLRKKRRWWYCSDFGFQQQCIDRHFLWEALYKPSKFVPGLAIPPDEADRAASLQGVFGAVVIIWKLRRGRGRRRKGWNG